LRLAGGVCIAGPGIIAAELHRRYGILGKTPVEPVTKAGTPGTGIEGGAARGETNPLLKSSRQIAEEQRRAADASKVLGDKANTSSTSISGLGSSAISAANSLGNVALAIGQLAAKISGISIPNLGGLNVPPATIAAPKPHALGGLFTRPHIGLVAEKWPELITPLGGPNKGLGLGGHTFQIHSAPVITVGAGTDLGDLKAALEEHARSLAQEVRKIIEIDLEREAVV
jgi:hypothetical protein